VAASGRRKGAAGCLFSSMSKDMDGMPPHYRERGLYVSAKRTHRFGRRFFMYPMYLEILMSFAGPVCRWVRFPKRTHRGGVLEVVSLKSGVILSQKWVRLRTEGVDADAKGCGAVGMVEALWLLEGLLVSREMVAANNSGVSSDSARQAQHDKPGRRRGRDAKTIRVGGCKNSFHKRVGSVKMTTFACLPHAHYLPASGRS